MKFVPVFQERAPQRTLLYLSDECSFYMEGGLDHIELELIVNKISLSIFEGVVVAVSGFCGLDTSMLKKLEVPVSSPGILKVEHNLKLGFAYAVNEAEFPVHVERYLGWVCLGDPTIKENAIEFISNCIAVIDRNGNLVALWLKPRELPKIRKKFWWVEERGFDLNQ